MPHEVDLPLARFEPRLFQEHQAGAVLLITPWNAKPAVGCLAVKLAGFREGAAEFAAALILQGSPYGDPADHTGEIIVDDDAGLRWTALPVLGLHSRTRIEVAVDAFWDMSQERSASRARGNVALGPSGVRIFGRSGDFPRGWSKAIDADTWTIDGTALNQRAMALTPNWSLILELDDGREVRIPVKGEPISKAIAQG